MQSREILAILSNKPFLGFILNSLRVFFMLVLVLFVTCPDESPSKGIRDTENPLADKSMLGWV